MQTAPLRIPYHFACTFHTFIDFKTASSYCLDAPPDIPSGFARHIANAAPSTSIECAIPREWGW